MSLSRSPSPQRGGGWSSPGLTTPYDGRSRRSSPIRAYPNGAAAAAAATTTHSVSWASAQARSREVRGEGGDGLGSRGKGWTSHLPYFHNGRSFADKEKLGRGRWGGSSSSPSSSAAAGPRAKWKAYAAFFGSALWKLRRQILAVVAVVTLVVLFYVTPLHTWYRRHFAGGRKFVIILAANQGGGVMEWKGPREWAIERDSVKNKRQYAKRWGYDLEIVDMSTKKRYAHEWRESWEKVDMVRNTMRKYPHAEWFWWLDLNTFIMEPTYSLQSHVFRALSQNTYRDINVYNPLNISHPPTSPYLDPDSLSATGDGKPSSINLIIPQDCGGFNLGSFFVRRSAWTDRLLDIWWDPVGYEQKHMEWEHKEQDALESMYTNQPWIRSHMAFIPQRKVNSFPPGACGDGSDPRIHYLERDRDFLVNMAGCEWGRDCWGEMYHYRTLSNHLNRNSWERFKDWVTNEEGKRRKRKEEEERRQREEQERQEREERERREREGEGSG